MEDAPYSPERVVRRGDVFWAVVPAEGAQDADEGIAHPHVVVQDDVLNRSRVRTVVVCALTSNLARADEPGNLRLDAGEGGLPRASVVVVSQIASVPRERLEVRLGTLTAGQVDRILEGLAFQQRSGAR